MPNLYLQLITPERTLFEGQLQSLSCQTLDGQITVLPGHIGLVSVLVPGEFIMRLPVGQEQILHVGGGILRVEGKENRVVVLADAAEHAVDIVAKASEEAIAAAKKRLEDTSLSDREFAAVISKLERDRTRLRIFRKHAHRHRAGITGEGVLEE